MLVLTDRMFADAGPWAQIEAAHSFGYDAVYMAAVPSPEAAEEIAKKGLVQYVMPEGVLDPETCESVAETLKRVHAIRLHDFGYAAGKRQQRRIGHGVLDWTAVFNVVREQNWQGDLIVDSCAQGNRSMENARALAAASRRDIEQLLHPCAPMENWHVVSPDAEGLHTVVSPQKTSCAVSNVLRLNLSAGKHFLLETGGQEMNAVLISGAARACCRAFDQSMERLDSFYAPGGMSIDILAKSDCVFYLAAAPCDGVGKPFFRRFDLSLPLGEIHQIHGSGSGEREVFFTLNPEMASSRLLCGLTWSRDGAWTIWPPHQHERDLEEVYCYFDMPVPGQGFHGSYLSSGGFATEGMLHPVSSGHMLLAPRGYHPTVATPGTRNAYFWVLTAFSHEQRRYDLAVPDPHFARL